jgi:ATP/ADP translocase
MWLLSVLMIVARALTARVERRARSMESPAAMSSDSIIRIVRRSRYIQILALGLVLSVVVGTLVDFQFKVLAQRMFPEPHELTRFLGAFYVALNAASLLLQFGAAGWLLQRLGLAAASGLEPGAVLLFSAGAAVATGGWIVVAMRWVQGILSQTLGKPSTEIY